MSNPLILVFTLLSILALLQGCAATVIGGTATGASVIHDRRSTGTVIDDQGIELEALKLMSQHPELGEHSSISTTSYNYTVLLTGEAETPEIRDRFAALIRGLPKVKRVVDEVTIGPSASFSQVSSDAYLTSKAKLALFDIKLPEFDPTRIKVITQQGQVFLMGLVSRAEADAVTEKIRNLRGVVRVVKVFEYVNP